MSFNLNEKVEDRAKREDIAAVLEAMGGDVLCLQEISSPAAVRWLARRLGMRYRLSALGSGGMTVLARRPIGGVRHHRIPGAYYNELVAVEVDGVWYASIHLNSELYKRDETVRMRETEWILRHFRPRRGVMAGDWNSVAHVDAKLGEAQPRGDKKDCKKQVLPSRLVHADGWVDALRRRPVSTWIPAGADGRERIDRIYARGVRAVGGGTLDHRAFPFLRGWPTGRDHRLVYVDVLKR